MMGCSGRGCGESRGVGGEYLGCHGLTATFSWISEVQAFVVNSTALSQAALCFSSFVSMGVFHALSHFTA